MTDWRPWTRLRSALHRGAPEEGPRPLAGLTLDGFRAWAYEEGLTWEEAVDDVVAAEGGHRLGSVRAQSLIEPATGALLVVEVGVTAGHPAPAADLAALMLRPVAPALDEARQAALETWLRGRLDHRGPYNAVTTLGGVQVAISIDDANPRGRTWLLTARPEPTAPAQPPEQPPH